MGDGKLRNQCGTTPELGCDRARGVLVEFTRVAAPVNGIRMYLAGLDVGSTTTSLLIASARLVRNCVTGRNELGDVMPVFRPDPVFTPFVGEDLDTARLELQLDRWLAEAHVEATSIATGGALVTGLAAQSANAAAV